MTWIQTSVSITCLEFIFITANVNFGTPRTTTLAYIIIFQLTDQLSKFQKLSQFDCFWHNAAMQVCYITAWLSVTCAQGPRRSQVGMPSILGTNRSRVSYTTHTKNVLKANENIGPLYPSSRTFRRGLTEVSPKHAHGSFLQDGPWHICWPYN